MVRSAAILAFIAACAAFGIVVAMQDTVIRGDVMAAKILEQVRERGIDRVACDERIPVGPHGATFTCQVFGNDGSTARLAYTMGRSGAYTATLIDSTPPTGPARKRPSGW